MNAASRLRRRGSRADYWPGFVDLMSTLLLVMIFLLVVYMLAQYFLQRTLSEEAEEKDDIQAELNSLDEMLSLEQQANADLRLNIAQLADQLQSSLSVRDQLIAELSMVTGERDTLQLRLREMTGEGQTALAEAAQASIRADAGEEKIKVLLSDVERLRRDIDALQAVRRDLEAKVSLMAAALVESRSELDQSEDETAAVRADLSALRDTTAELEARLSDEQERTVLAQRTLEEREIRLAEVQALHLAAQTTIEGNEASLSETRALSARQRDQIAVLNQQLDALRAQLNRVEQALQISELKSEEQEVTIANLGQRLNMALAAKVEELAAYRSEFFGRLREVLSERRDFTIIGDRFVFQSEVLFASASDRAGGGRPRAALAVRPGPQGGHGSDPDGAAVDPAGRRPHRRPADPDGALPVQLGAFDRARDLGGELPHRPRHPAGAAQRHRLRRVPAPRRPRRRDRPPPQPPHRAEADAAVALTALPAVAAGACGATARRLARGRRIRGGPRSRPCRELVERRARSGMLPRSASAAPPPSSSSRPSLNWSAARRA